MRTRTIVTAAILTVSAVTVTGCASETSTVSTGAVISVATEAANDAAAAVETQSQVTIIDVRTPEEFASGHVDGAININLQDPSFQSQIDALDKSGAYVVYCRSGNRSAQAVTIMTNSGFGNVTDLGSVESASETLGVSVVS